MVGKQVYIVFDHVAAFERMVRDGQFPKGGTFRKSLMRYETEGAIWQQARSLERVQGYSRDCIVLVNRKNNPLKSKEEMRYVLATWPNIQFYGEE